MTNCDIAVVGAGPYGLSAAAHLRADGKVVRVFGKTMSFWENHMPIGMFLRSPWAASNLSDPQKKLRLDSYKQFSGNHLAAPIPLKRFVEYGRWFQGHAVPDVDSRTVASVERDSSGFLLTLEDGEPVKAQRVVVASGIVPFAWRPPQFNGLTPDHASHSVEHRDLRRFAGQRLAVVGAGQSALESAALLHEAGIEVEVFVRNPFVRYLHQTPIIHHWPVAPLLYAWPDVGPAFVSHLVASPNLFRQLPRRTQDRLGPRSIRAAGAAWLKPRLQDVPITTGQTVTSATPDGKELKVTLSDGSSRCVNHVLLATGFRVNIAQYPFLSEKLLSAVDQCDGYPKLNSHFESSVPGLHFLGAPAAWSFGPLMRFVAGSDFAARALAQGVASKT